MCVEAVTLCRGCYAPHTSISHTILVLLGGERLSTLQRLLLGYFGLPHDHGDHHTPHVRCPRTNTRSRDHYLLGGHILYLDFGFLDFMYVCM